jgi:DNA topoisomerase IB
MVAGRQVPAHREELPGQELLQFVDKAGNCQDATSTDVNDHLKEIIGQGYYSEGLPHLGGNGSRGDGAQ